MQLQLQSQHSSKIQIQIKEGELQITSQQKSLDLYSPQKITAYIKINYKKIKHQQQKINSLKKFYYQIIDLFIKLRIIFQQLWCQLVPICIRGRFPGELIFIQRHKNSYFGYTNNIIYKLMQDQKYFYLIVYQGNSQTNIYDIVSRQQLLIINDTKTLFVNRLSKQHQKLKLYKPVKGINPPKYPLLHVCKQNICKDLISFAEIQLENLSSDDLSLLLKEVQTQIRGYQEIETQVKLKIDQGQQQ